MFCSVLLWFLSFSGSPGRSLLMSFSEKFAFSSGKGHPSILLDPTVFWSYFRGPALSGRGEILRKNG